MNSDQLEQFKVIAECENLTKAAEVLYISQPALSKTLKNLEVELGCNLFYRTGKKLNITKEGRSLLEYANGVTTIIDHAQQELKFRNEGIKAKVFGIGYYLPELFGTYYDKHYSDLDLQVIQDDLIPDMLIKKHADMIITDDFYMRHYSNHGIEKVLLFQEQLLLNVPRDHQFFFREWIPINEIQEEPLVYVEMQTGIDHWIKEIQKINRCKLNINMRLSPLLFQQVQNKIPLAYLTSSSTHIFDEQKKMEAGWKKIRVNALYTNRYIYLWYYKKDFRRLVDIVETIKENAVNAGSGFEFARTLS